MMFMNYFNPDDYWSRQDDIYRKMSDNERLQAGCLHVLFYIVAVGIVLAVCALFGSCATTKYVSVVEHRTDTLLKYSSIRDSIYMHDSIHVHENGDTVLIERWHTRWRDRWHSDTVYRAMTDTIPLLYTVTKEVPAQLTWWQQTRLHLADILLCGLFLIAIIFVTKKALSS